MLPPGSSRSPVQVANSTVKWLSDRTSQFYTVTRGPNPPDFLLNPGSWLELSDIYLSNEEAKFDNSREDGKFTFECSPEEHTSELQSRQYLVCRLLLEKKKKKK